MGAIIADYCELLGLPEWGKRWRIGSIDDGESEPWLLSCYERGPSEYDLYFTSQRDAERAIEALRDNGIVTGNQLETTDSDLIRRICYSALCW